MRGLMIVAATMAATSQAVAADAVFDAVTNNVSRQCVDQVHSRGFRHFDADYNYGIVPIFIADRHAYYWFAVCMEQAGFPLR